MGKAIQAVASPIASILGGAPPKMPKVEAPTPMPTADDDAIMAARRRKAASVQQRQGVQSTLLTQGQRETLGG